MTDPTLVKWGIVRVSRSVWDGLNKPILPEEWHEVLMLPDDWEILSSTLDDEYGFFEICVSHNCLPHTNDHKNTSVVLSYKAIAHSLEIEPNKYKNLYSHKTYLDKIIVQQYDGKQWREFFTMQIFLPAELVIQEEDIHAKHKQ